MASLKPITKPIWKTLCNTKILFYLYCEIVLTSRCLTLWYLSCYIAKRLVNYYNISSFVQPNVPLCTHFHKCLQEVGKKQYKFIKQVCRCVGHYVSSSRFGYSVTGICLQDYYLSFGDFICFWKLMQALYDEIIWRRLMVVWLSVILLKPPITLYCHGHFLVYRTQD